MIHPGEKFCGCVQRHAARVLLKKLCPSRGGKKCVSVSWCSISSLLKWLGVASAFPLYSVHRFPNSPSAPWAVNQACQWAGDSFPYGCRCVW